MTPMVLKIKIIIVPTVTKTAMILKIYIQYIYKKIIKI